MDELIFASVGTMAAAVRDRQVSAVELVEAHLRHIDAVNPQLSAIVTLDAENALRQARHADRAIARGDADALGRLHGVPMTIKDSLDTAGLISTWGTPGRANHVPERDATVVSRLKSAGAILLGKSNTPELTLSYDTDNPIFGRTNNPYNLDRSPGGSSGGAAAIVASGGSPFDIGSDTGGSIRLPAHFCGIAGIKPTSGRVPRTSHAVSPFGWLNSLTQLGPLARYASDLAPLLHIISGPDGQDPFVAPVPLRESHEVDVPALRIAFHTDNGIRPAEPDVSEVVKLAARSLAAAGATLIEAKPDGIEETVDLLRTLMRGADGALWTQRLLEEVGTATADSSLHRYLDVPPGSVELMVDTISRWDRFRGRMLSFMHDFDLILCPVNAFPALPHGTYAGENYTGFSYTMSYNLTGWPAAVVRCGTSEEGLPIGVQAVARPWREDVALAVIQHLEEAFGGWRPPTLPVD